MNPALKNVLELVASGMFMLLSFSWPAQAILGEKDWWPLGVIGLISMVWWMQVFADRWKKI